MFRTTPLPTQTIKKKELIRVFRAGYCHPFRFSATSEPILIRLVCFCSCRKTFRQPPSAAMLVLLLAALAAAPALTQAAPAPAPQPAARAPAEITADPEQLELLSAYLTRLLVDGWPEGEPPLLYVEAGDPEAEREGEAADPDVGVGAQPFWKRSRYYRRYPWKRQNGRYQPADDRYLCQPTREDVFQLLVALHEARRGDSSRTVSFCNRRRPASAIFTNIRFLGR